MISKIYLMVAVTMVIIGSTLGLSSPVSAAACGDQSLFGIPAWFNHLTVTENGSCSVKNPGNGPNDLSKFIWTIALNILQAALVIVAYVTIFFLLKGGFMYMTAAGASDKMVSAKKTITNAVIGLIIALLAASIVNAVAGAINS